jgi:hypothetical protein
MKIQLLEILKNEKPLLIVEIPNLSLLYFIEPLHKVTISLAKM